MNRTNLFGINNKKLFSLRTTLLSLIPCLALITFTFLLLSSASHATPAKGKIVEPKPFQPASETAESREGKGIFHKERCTTCHTTSDTGGCLAPPLDGVGARRSEDFILKRITAGDEDKFADMYGQAELMPHLRIPDREARLVAKYLLTLPEPKKGFLVIGHGEKKHGVEHPSDAATFTEGRKKASALAESVKRGRTLLFQKGCLACHSIGNIGGKFAPKFDAISRRLSRQAIASQMKNAELLALRDDTEYGARGTEMPPLNLSHQDIEDLTNYLMTLE